LWRGRKLLLQGVRTCPETRAATVTRYAGVWFVRKYGRGVLLHRTGGGTGNLPTLRGEETRLP
jgi:hypothetical protein